MINVYMKLLQRHYGEAISPLDGDSVHLWLLPLLQFPPTLTCLQSDEWTRARRFRFEQDQLRWIAARSMLRRLLATYLDQAADALRFVYTAYGKPSLADHPHVTFNLSHSGDYGLLAVTLNRQVGIDIERIRPDFADPSVASHFFSQAEQIALAAYAPIEYADAFFTCWTRKESYIKAQGEGLSHPLKDFDVSLLPDIEDALVATRPDTNEKHNWRIMPVQVPGQYAAAVTLERTNTNHNIACEHAEVE
jgi:4'-phosphopantetheinyl transferase